MTGETLSTEVLYGEDKTETKKNVGEYNAYVQAVKIVGADGKTETTGNYAITPKDGKLTISQSSELNVNVTGYEGTYDGQPHTGSIEVTGVGDEAVAYEVTYTYGGKTTKEMPHVTNVVDTLNGVEVEVTSANYKTVKRTINFIVKVRPVEVVAKSNENITYDGAEHKADETSAEAKQYTVSAATEATGVVTGETLSAEVVYGEDKTETKKNVGEYEAQVQKREDCRSIWQGNNRELLNYA